MQAKRLEEVDALRGLAAIAVLLFHYSTRISQLYGEQAAFSVAFPHGDLGVNLFFIISGFVIFMTLNATNRPMDFVVGRFSRLFPTYWAAIAVTFTVTAALGLPGRTVSAFEALANFVMIHGLFGVRHVDGVYWTLEVELLFYAMMLVLFAVGLLHRVHLVLLGLLALAALATAAGGPPVPGVVKRLLILDHLAWFVLGICVHLHTRPRQADDRARSLWLGVSALVTIGLAHGSLAVVALVLTLTVWAAASGSLPFLRFSPLVWLGAVSYPLYLIHQNVGYSLILAIQRSGIDRDVAALGATLASLCIAGALHRAVELPAMAFIREWWRGSTTSARRLPERS